MIEWLVILQLLLKCKMKNTNTLSVVNLVKVKAISEYIEFILDYSGISIINDTVQVYCLG